MESQDLVRKLAPVRELKMPNHIDMTRSRIYTRGVLLEHCFYVNLIRRIKHFAVHVFDMGSFLQEMQENRFSSNVS